MRTVLIIALCLVVSLAVIACGPAEDPESDDQDMAGEMSSDEHTETGEASTDEHDDMDMSGGEKTETDEHEGMDMSSGGSMGGDPINVLLTDMGATYSMTPEVHGVHAGPVTFVANNEGLIEHELIVVKLLDMGVDLTTLHVVEEQVVETEVGGVVYIEDAAGNLIGQVLASTGHGAHLLAGHTVELNADLVAGHYLLLCNIETHYQLGMWSEFEAT